MTSLSRTVMGSQSSQSSGTPVNLTPNTHKRTHALAPSPFASPLMSSHVNDDDSEKRHRLRARLSDIAQRHMASPASER